MSQPSDFDQLKIFLTLLALFGAIGALIKKAKKIVASSKKSLPVGEGGKSILTGVALSLLCAVIWAASYSTFPKLSPAIKSQETCTLLFAIAGVAYLISSLFIKKENKFSYFPKGIKTSTYIALIFANLGNFYFSIFALKYLSASEAMAINNVSPIITAAILIYTGKMVFRLEYIPLFVLIIIGVGTINYKSGNLFDWQNVLIGTLISVAAGASFSIWKIIMDHLETLKLSAFDRVSLLSIVFVASALIAFFYTIFCGGFHPISNQDFIVLLINGLRVALVYFILQFAIKKSGALITSTVLVLMVPLTFPFDLVFNKNSITPQLVIGTLIIIAISSIFIFQEYEKEKLK